MTKAATKPMPARALKALKASIEKWRRNEAGDYRGIFTDTCPLCKLFHAAENPKILEDDCCKKCPVYWRTGYSDCVNTPHSRVYHAWHDDGYASRKFRTAAKKEREFLESLLPKEAR